MTKEDELTPEQQKGHDLFMHQAKTGIRCGSCGTDEETLYDNVNKSPMKHCSKCIETLSSMVAGRITPQEAEEIYSSREMANISKFTKAQGI